ncbi:MAG TPA: condensation domain-containing protein, partial [Terriglobales bacterium]|nr:condensation domain-containing protein [Terriglobales bacterium]
MSEAVFPTSFAQQRLCFLDQLEPGTAAYNLPRAFRITGDLDVQAMKYALETVVRRHESLRTVFDNGDGQDKQIVLPEVSVQLPIVDLQGIPEVDREQEGIRIAAETGKKPFDLSRGPLLRSVLVRLSAKDHLLVLVMHHIITDGWSIANLFRELTRSYEAFLTGAKPDLPELPLQYAEYAQWQREYLSGDVLSREVDYWRNKLAGAPTLLDLPTDHPHPNTHNWQGATEELVLDPETLARMKALAQTEGATLFMVSLAVFQSLLWRYTGQESILVGTPVAGRGDLQIEKLIGFFVNTLVFRADFSDGMTFRELLRQIRSFALDAYMHQDVPFEKLVEELVPQRSLDTTPLFQVMFTFQNIPKQIFRISGLDIEEVEFETGISKFDLSLELYEHEGLHCRFEYNTDLFERATIRRMMAHFERLVTAAINTPDQGLAEVPLMTAADQKLISRWNQTDAGFPRDLSLSAAFERRASETPDSVALLFEHRKVTYRELNEQANRLANFLIRRGLKPGAKVGVCIERSPGMLSGLLGVLKAGAAYVPFDPSYPSERLAAMLDDSKVWGVITNGRNIAYLPSQAVNVVAIDGDHQALDAESGQEPSLATATDQAAYLIYTSGSTGVPRGVLGTHRAAINRFAWMWERFPFQPGEVCCHKTN